VEATQKKWLLTYILPAEVPKALRTWIPTTAILYQFEKLTSNKSIMKEDANFVAYNAEIMLKVDCDVNPVGVAELNAELGYKMLPKRT
jgi:hypothetical protein